MTDGPARPTERRRDRPFKRVREPWMGQRGNFPVHGVTAIKTRGEAALTPAQLDDLSDLKADLDTSEGLRLTLVRRTALGLVMLQTIEKYLSDQVQAGMPLDELPILKAWPAFSNATARLLNQLRAMTPAIDDGHTAELERIHAAVGVNPSVPTPDEPEECGDE